eukprot:TRINITY_DN8098_c0_g1_i1.p2 TRINITY_DN8098_c0_g1~~TRINITY_DN8098_c0_g1_i1.p2  ORF type:complete len:245 (-),score=54.36 TRINITY_DN8098_c0_g1_i1:100-834(-)
MISESDNQRQRLMELAQKREDLEKELKILQGALQTMDKNGINGKFVDAEGFPLPHVGFDSIADYRNTVRRIKEIESDLRDIMKELEKGLFSLHEAYRVSGRAEQEINEYESNLDERKAKKAADAAAQAELNKDDNLVPFCKIVKVAPGSPADVDGLRNDDIIYKFGHATFDNHNNLELLKNIVKDSIDKTIEVRVLRPVNEGDDISDQNNVMSYKERDHVKVQVILTPRKWAGGGVVGCGFDKL